MRRCTQMGWQQHCDHYLCGFSLALARLVLIHSLYCTHFIVIQKKQILQDVDIHSLEAMPSASWTQNSQHATEQTPKVWFWYPLLLFFKRNSFCDVTSPGALKSAFLESHYTMRCCKVAEFIFYMWSKLQWTRFCADVKDKEEYCSDLVANQKSCTFWGVQEGVAFLLVGIRAAAQKKKCVKLRDFHPCLFYQLLTSSWSAVTHWIADFQGL